MNRKSVPFILIMILLLLSTGGAYAHAAGGDQSNTNQFVISEDDAKIILRHAASLLGISSNYYQFANSSHLQFSTSEPNPTIGEDGKPKYGPDPLPVDWGMGLFGPQPYCQQLSGEWMSGYYQFNGMDGCTAEGRNTNQYIISWEDERISYSATVYVNHSLNKDVAQQGSFNELLWLAEALYQAIGDYISGDIPAGEELTDEEVVEEEETEGIEPEVSSFDIAWESPLAGFLRSPTLPLIGSLAGMALTWFLSKPKPGSTPGQPTKGLKYGDVNEQGKFWSPQPWDEAGDGWVNEEEYKATKYWLENGYKWTKDGWKKPEDISQYEEWQRKNKEVTQKEDQEFLDSLKKQEQEFARKQQEGLEKQSKLRQLREDQEDLERQARWDNQAARPLLTKRELFTLCDENGNLSYKGLLIRTTTAMVTGGWSEAAAIPIQAGYSITDGLKEGQSLGTVLAKTATETAVVIAAPTVISTAAKWIGKTALTAGKSLYSKAATTAEKVFGKPKTISGSLLKITPELSKIRSSVDEVLEMAKGLKNGKVSQEDFDTAIVKLYKNGKMKDLKKLEQAGQLTKEEVQVLNSSTGKHIDDILSNSTQKAMDQTQMSTKVKIEEVMLGDSGSSARRFAGRSVYTDADRTLIVKYNKADLQKYADKFHKGNLREAEEQLTKQFKANQEKLINKEFIKKGYASADDLDCKLYKSFGKPGPTDSYPANHVKSVMAVEGKTIVYKVNSKGEFTSYKTSGQAITDQHALLTKKPGQSLESFPRMTFKDAIGLAEQQIKAVSKEGLTPEKVSKALLRIDKAANITHLGGIDPSLLAAAKAWRSVDLQAMFASWSLEKQKLYMETAKKVVLLLGKSIIGGK